jgi:hypothetical protein
MKTVLVLSCVLAMGSLASAQLITDDFEVDSSANYTVVEQGGPDATATFGFDYVAAGIPIAPNSPAGQVGGLRMTANDTLQATNQITAFHNTQLVGFTDYSLRVDVYMGVTGTGGTTEHMHVGIAGDGLTANSLFSPIQGSGHFMAMTGEGGSSSDYRHSTPSTLAVPSGDASYLNDLNTTNATGDTYQNLFPSPPYEFAGSPGNAWTTLEIRVQGGMVTYLLEGETGLTPIIQTPAEATDGYVSLGHGDLFTSVAAPFQSQFVIFDNLVVTPEPATMGLLALGFVTLLRRR